MKLQRLFSSARTLACQRWTQKRSAKLLYCVFAQSCFSLVADAVASPVLTFLGLRNHILGILPMRSTMQHLSCVELDERTSACRTSRGHRFPPVRCLHRVGNAASPGFRLSLSKELQILLTEREAIPVLTRLIETLALFQESKPVAITNR